MLPLSSQDDAAIERLLDAAFGIDRHGRTAYRIRAGTRPIDALSFAVVANAMLVGTVQCWPVALTGADGVLHPLVMVGPVAVLPDHQSAGIGRMLVDRVIAAAREQGSPPLMMIGDPEYYGRFWGFSAEGTAGWEAPGPVERRRLLAVSPTGAAIPGAGMLGPHPGGHGTARTT